jgi:DNA-binding NarL/FixJ family response regulator
MIHILLADHHANALWALKTLIQEEPGLEVVGEADDGQSLIDLSSALYPDLILIDKDLPGNPIENLIAALHLLKPRPTVIVMSSDPEYGRMMLRAGADAFVSKGDQVDWLLQILRNYKKRIIKKEERIGPNKPY